MNKEIGLGLVGTTLSATGTLTQTNELLQMISLIVTILGAVISFIVIPVLNWHAKAKQDGKITKEEIEEGLDTLQEGIGKVNDTLKDKKEDK